MESGIYYLAAAAVTHLGDRPAHTELHVHLEHRDGRLAARVDDPELGPGSAAALRAELAGDIERLAALGGDVEVTEYAAGVTIVAWLPDRLEPLVGPGSRRTRRVTGAVSVRRAHAGPAPAGRRGGAAGARRARRPARAVHRGLARLARAGRRRLRRRSTGRRWRGRSPRRRPRAARGPGPSPAAAPASEPLGQAVLDYGFSTLNLVLAVVLLASGTRETGMRTWPIRLLAVALVGSAGAFNLQAHAAARAIEAGDRAGRERRASDRAARRRLRRLHPGAAGVPHARRGTGCPVPGRPAAGWPSSATVTFLLVGLGTALLPHTTSCVLFFGFLVPAVGLVVLPRRVRRGPVAEARTQARLLFSTLVGGFAVAVVLGIVTVLLDVLGEAPGLTLVDPTAHGAVRTRRTGSRPIALLFWFSRLASAAIAVVVLVATRHDRLWTAERRFSRGLAVLLVMAVGGGGFVVLQTITAAVLGAAGDRPRWRRCWWRWPSGRCTSGPSGWSTGCSTARGRRRTACSPTSPR